MSKFKIMDLEEGDYVQLKLRDGWYKITGFSGARSDIDLINSCCTSVDCDIDDIADVKLESEMPYGENF